MNAEGYKIRKDDRGVRYVAPWRSAPPLFVRCYGCGRAWDDDTSTSVTPAPAGRCPFEHMRGHA